MKTVSGYVENITFRNEDNGFTVLTLSSGKEDITCTGNFGYIGQGEYVEIEGEEVFHEIYGKQIKAINYKIVPATDELSLKKYLGSGAIKGLGAVLADRIVDKFGEETAMASPFRAGSRSALQKSEELLQERLWTLVLSLKKKRICVML